MGLHVIKLNVASEDSCSTEEFLSTSGSVLHLFYSVLEIKDLESKNSSLKLASRSTA